MNTGSAIESSGVLRYGPMVSDPALLAQLRESLRDDSTVRLAFLFGSRSVGRARADSDFDIGVVLSAEAALADRGKTVRTLAANLGRVVSAALVDLVVLNDAPALLRHRVLRDGEVIVERSPEERVRFAIKTIREYQDMQVRREQATRARIERLKAGIADGGSRDLLEKARRAARLFGKASRVP